MSRRGSAVAVDPTARTVTVGDTTVHLTRTQFDLLSELHRQAGTVVSREDLCALLWGERVFGGDHRLDVHMSRIRARLTAAGAPEDALLTVRGVGYRLQPDPSASRRASRERPPAPQDAAHVMLGVDGVIAWATANVRSLLGLTPSDLVGRSLLELVHPEDRQNVAEHTRALVAGTAGQLAFRASRRPGEYRWITAMDRPVLTQGGQPLGALADWFPGRVAPPAPTPRPDVEPITLPVLPGMNLPRASNRSAPHRRT